MARLFRRLQLLFGRQRFDADVRREIEFHVAMETEERRRTGQSEDTARRAALLNFGGVSRIREEVNDARGLTFWDGLGQDLRFALRTLRRSPGYTLAAVLILGLGIGANTAMFSVIKGVLLEPLPFRQGDRLVLVQQEAPRSGVQDAGVSIAEFRDYRDRLTSVNDLVEYHSMSFVLLNQGDPDRVDTGVVSANFFDMLGIRPALGRSFVEPDAVLGAEAVLILSHAYWQQKFGGAEDVIGRVLQMNNKPHTVVGVLPDFPQYPRKNDIYMPTSACPFRAAAEARPRRGHRSFAGLLVFGRLAPGATVERAASEVAPIAQSFERDYRADHAATGSLGFTGRTVSLFEELVTGARSMLYALVGVTALVLLIACANVANLSLGRTLRRGRELSVRTALGASRGRLFRQLLTESVVVAVAGGALGLLMAWLSLDLLVAYVERFTPRTSQIAIDGAVLAFTLTAAVVTGIIFGLAPAMATRRHLSQEVRDGGAQAGESAARRRVRSGLVVAQVAVSFVLVVGAGLLLESLYRRATVPLGFDAEKVMTAAIFGNFSNSNDLQSAARIESGILERLRSSPGVRSAALTNAVPQSAIQPFDQPITLAGRPAEDTRTLQADLNFASDQYLATLGVPLLAGRDFAAGDTVAAPQVAIVNASMAAFWAGDDPVGRQFTAQVFGASRTMTVVGVAADFRLYSVDQDVSAQFYVPVSQAPGMGGRLLVRTDGNPIDVAPIMRAAVHATDPNTPVEEIATLGEVRGTTQLAPRALGAALVSIFAVIALLITLGGVAGVIGTSVSQRTREFGLRMALGASRASVLSLVVRQGVVLVAAGIVIGLGGAYLFTQLIESFLFRTAPTDPIAYAAGALVFLLAALLAAAGPARRATSIDPLQALKTD